MAAHVAAMIGFRTALAAPLALRRASRVRATPQTRRGNDARFVVRAEIRRIASPDGTVPDLPNVTFKPPPIVDRAACKSGMMHIGVGGFHRSHQQVRAASPNRAELLASLRGRKRPRNTSHVELHHPTRNPRGRQPPRVTLDGFSVPSITAVESSTTVPDGHRTGRGSQASDPRRDSRGRDPILPH